MNEDLSATIRTGVTVVIVAALVSTVLSLMVVAQTILSAGQGTLQSGVDRVSLQQFEVYNGGSQSGTDVKAAVSLYASQDLAILIHTKSMDADDSMGSEYYYNFNALLGTTKPDGSADPYFKPADETVAGTQTRVYKGVKSDTNLHVVQGQPYLVSELATTNGVIAFNGDVKILTTKGSNCYILDSARFNSQLIKDKNDLIIGIIFTQR